MEIRITVDNFEAGSEKVLVQMMYVRFTGSHVAVCLPAFGLPFRILTPLSNQPALSFCHIKHRRNTPLAISLHPAVLTKEMTCNAKCGSLCGTLTVLDMSQ
jgi:hypothetical protein